MGDFLGWWQSQKYRQPVLKNLVFTHFPTKILPGFKQLDRWTDSRWEAADSLKDRENSEKQKTGRLLTVRKSEVQSAQPKLSTQAYKNVGERVTLFKEIQKYRDNSILMWYKQFWNLFTIFIKYEFNQLPSTGSSELPAHSLSIQQDKSSIESIQLNVEGEFFCVPVYT